MTKREFLKELEDRLQMLDEKERKDMIEEYSQHISTVSYTHLLASGVLLVGSSKNQLGDLRKKTGDIEYSGNKILLD